MCKSSSQDDIMNISTPRPGALPVAQPTVLEHCREIVEYIGNAKLYVRPATWPWRMLLLLVVVCRL